MSKFVVDLDEQKDEAGSETEVSPSGYSRQPKRPGGCLKIFAALGILTVVLLLIAGIGGAFYWLSVKKTPPYSLALLVDAARRNDKEKVAELVDTERVVSSFVPQITEKAIELYGRNLPSVILARVAQIAVPLIPEIKERAKEELPNLIREKTGKFESVPYWLIALGAERALDIKIEGDTAQIKSKVPERPLELTMKRDGQLWKVVAIKDEALAKRIAEKIGQQLIALAGKGSLQGAEKQLGIEKLGDALKNLNDIFKQNDDQK